MQASYCDKILTVLINRLVVKLFCFYQHQLWKKSKNYKAREEFVDCIMNKINISTFAQFVKILIVVK